MEIDTEKWLSLSEVLTYLIENGHEEEDIKDKLPAALEYCQVRCKGLSDRELSVNSNGVIFGLLWLQANIDWDRSAASVEERIEEDIVTHMISELFVSKKDVDVWANLSEPAIGIECWPHSTLIKLTHAAGVIYNLKPEIWANEPQSIGDVFEDRRVISIQKTHGFFSYIKKIAVENKLHVYGKRSGKGVHTLITVDEWKKSEIETDALLGSGAVPADDFGVKRTFRNGTVWSSLRFQFHEIMEIRGGKYSSNGDKHYRDYGLLPRNAQMIKSDLELWSGGVTWVDREYDENINVDYQSHDDGQRLISDTQELISDDSQESAETKSLPDSLVSEPSIGGGKYKSGLPGPPNMKHFYMEELERLHNSGGLEDGVTKQAEKLKEWAKKHHPKMAPSNITSIENSIRERYKQMKFEAAQKTIE